MALPMPPMPPGPPYPCEGDEPLCAARVFEPLETMTASPACSEPLTGATAACVPLMSPIFTRTGAGLPPRWMKTTPLPPATGAAPAPAAVCPHGDGLAAAPDD